MDLAKVKAKAGQAKENVSRACTKASEMTKSAKSSAIAYHESHPDFLGNAVGGAKDFFSECARRAFLPTRDLQDFFERPDIDKILEKPELLFEGLQALAIMKHPKAALYSTFVTVRQFVLLSSCMTKETYANS